MLPLTLVPFLLALYATGVAPLQQQQEGLRVTGCRGQEPSDDFITGIRLLREESYMPLARRIDRPPTLLVDVHLHIVEAEEEQHHSRISEEMIESQTRELSYQYRSIGIAFRLLSVSRTTDTTWARGGDDEVMKSVLRQGTYSTLNVYFLSQLATNPQSPEDTQFLGFSTLPDASGTNNSYALDGCTVHAGSMPGGYLVDNNLGRTAVHEVGHWLGLLHTFQGNSCDGEGDLIDDTRQEMTSTKGCPVDKNSCPELPGVDPITNFMDYSSDECYEGFTEGQRHRMFDMFTLFRLGK